MGDIGKRMDDLYVTHTESLKGTIISKGNLAKTKDSAVNELAAKYEGNPNAVESDFLWCDTWITLIEQHFAHVNPDNKTKALFLSAPLPELRSDFDDVSNRQIKPLLHIVFKSWKSKGRIKPFDQYHQLMVDQISRQCLRAWSKDLLQKLAGVRTIPLEVDAHPLLQRRFFHANIATDKGAFYPAVLHEVLLPFREFVGPGKRFLDLGSGDGRITFLANILGADATGIEFDRNLINVSENALQRLEGIVDEDRIHFIQSDFFKIPWSDYDVIFYYDQSSFEQERVREKLIAELSPEAMLIVLRQSNSFPGMELISSYPHVNILRKADLEITN